MEALPVVFIVVLLFSGFLQKSLNGMSVPRGNPRVKFRYLIVVPA